MWRLNMIPNNQRVNEIKRKIKNILKKNGNITYQKLQDVAKAIPRENFIALYPYIKKGKSQLNSLTLYLKEIEKEEQQKPNVSKRKEI